jgi:hypothetical protein
MTPFGTAWRSSTTAALGAVVAAGSLLLAAPAAGGDLCDPTRGVRVVVDHGPLSAGVHTRCVADGAGKSAAEVTEDAGFEITWVQRYRGSFVCRLGGRPRDLQCADTPPADRYWGLFHAAPGDQSWTFAAQGAASWTAPAGGVVGWRFQNDGERVGPAVERGAMPGDELPSETARETARVVEGPVDEAAGEDQRSATLTGLALISAMCVAGFVVVTRRRSS